MNDWKSKLPDFQELTSISTKLFKDLKKSVGEIIDDYKKKRDQPVEEQAEQSSTAKPTEPTKQAATQSEPVDSAKESPPSSDDIIASHQKKAKKVESPAASDNLTPDKAEAMQATVVEEQPVVPVDPPIQQGDTED